MRALWTDIAREVNGVNGQNDRTPKDLKKKYQNFLNIAKSKERQNKVTSRETGGGPSEELPLSTVEQMALDNVSSVHVEGIDGGFDANRSILVGVDNEIGSTLSSISTIIALSPDREKVSQLNGQDLVGTIGEGLRAVYGSVQVGVNDADRFYGDFSSDDDQSTQPPDSPSELFGLSAPRSPAVELIPTQAAEPGPSTQAAQPAQPVTPGPIRSNRTVTRDLRRQEFKEILQRKDKLNDLLSNTNNILLQILNELKKRA